MSNIAREGKAPTYTCMRAPNKAPEPALSENTTLHFEIYMMLRYTGCAGYHAHRPQQAVTG